MGVLVPKQFNFNLLLQFLQRVYGEEMTSAMLSQLLRDGEEGGIKGEPIPETVLRGGGMSWEREYGAGGYILDAGIKRKPIVRVPTGRIADWIVSRDEVLRFIAEHPPTAAAPEPATIETESLKMTDADIEDYVTQQRLDGVADKAIIIELLQRKTVSGKNVSKQKIGKAMHPNPDMVTDSAFTHYVTKLLNKG